MKTRHIATLGQLPINSTHLGQTLTLRERKKDCWGKNMIFSMDIPTKEEKNIEKPPKKIENPAQRVK
jgi:hypothetical protein